MDDHTPLIAKLIQSEMTLIGPSVAISIARRVNGLNVGGNGDVLSISGNPQAVLEELTHAYTTFSPEAARLALEYTDSQHPQSSLL